MILATPSRLDKFFDALRLLSPFASNRVDGPANALVDVETIHAAEFQTLVQLAQQASTRSQGIGVLLSGEPGTGKSHLLSRLWRWAEQQDQAVCVYVQNPQPGPERMARYLVRCVLSALTLGRVSAFHNTRLYRLVRMAVQEACRQNHDTDRTPQHLQAAFYRLVDRFLAENPAQATLIDRALFRTLLRFYLSANVAFHHSAKDDHLAALAVQWLSGEGLDPSAAHDLGLLPATDSEEVGALRTEEDFMKVLAVLARLAALQRQPLVLCFDQIDSLNPEQVGVLARFLHALLDRSGNLLVICCGAMNTMVQLRNSGAVHPVTWERLGQVKMRVGRINHSQGRRILEARLATCLEPFADVPELVEQRAQDPLFPLGRSWFDFRLRNLNDFPPRDLLTWANQYWQRQQQSLTALPGPQWLEEWPGEAPALPRPAAAPKSGVLAAAIDERVEQTLAEHRAQRKLLPHTLPPSADNLEGLIHALIQQGKRGHPVEVRRPAPSNREVPPPYDLLLQHMPKPAAAPVATGLVFLTTSSVTHATRCLSRLVEDDRPPDRVLLVTEERQPIPLGADADAQGRQHLETLRGRGATRFQQVELTFDQYAELDALQAVVGLARSGDLSLTLPGERLRPISMAEVIASHQRRDRYGVQPLLRLLLSRDGPDAESASAVRNNDGPLAHETEGNGKRVKEEVVVVEETDLREFIMAQLGLLPGVSSQELALRFSEHMRTTRSVKVEGAKCKPLVEAVVLKMQRLGLVRATPVEDGLYLLQESR